MSGVIHLQTEIPGPRSRALLARRARGAERRARGHPDRGRACRRCCHHGPGRQPAHRLRRRHRRGEHRASPSRCRGGGATPARPVRPRLLSGVDLRALRRAGRAPQPDHSGHARQADLFRQQRRRGGRERGEGGEKLHRPAGDSLFRAWISWPDQSGDGAHVQGGALQGRVRPLRSRDLPHPVSLLLSVRGGTQGRPMLPRGPDAARGTAGCNGRSRVGGGRDHGAGAG